MRLLKTDTIQLEEFISGNVPKYAILSHRWGREEVALQDLELGRAESKAGYEKLRRCCVKAQADGFAYVWIDTCCIDKTSSAELSEAINSMFRWYSESTRCYAFLADVPTAKDDIAQSEWFERGFTLQELVAPQDVVFLSAEWSEMGTKQSLQCEISKRTRIPVRILTGEAAMGSASVAQRMSWAAGRKTARTEDRAYCLMGIFQINMPLLYGEGERAFIRLQEEIINTIDDQSLFAWKSPDSRGGLLAMSPDAFADAEDIVPSDEFLSITTQASVSSRGVHLDIDFEAEGPNARGLAVLSCWREETREYIGIYVKDVSWTMDVFERVACQVIEELYKLWFGDRLMRRRVCVRSGHDTSLQRRTEAADSGRLYFSLNVLNAKIGAAEDGLIKAARQLHLDALWYMLAKPNVDVNAISSEGETALLVAVERQNRTAVHMLLSQPGIDPDIRNRQGKAALAVACGRSDREIVQRLLLHGADVNAEDHHGQTPLWEAIRGQHGDNMELLLQRGAKVTDHEDGRGPLLVAAREGNKVAAMILLRHTPADVNERDALGRTPMHCAAEGGHERLVKLLLHHGADPGALDSMGRTPLGVLQAAGADLTAAALARPRRHRPLDKLQSPAADLEQLLRECEAAHREEHLSEVPEAEPREASKECSEMPG